MLQTQQSQINALTSSQGSNSRITNQSQTTPHTNDSISNEAPNPFYRKPIPVNRWNISFSGDNRDLQLRRFLNKLKFLASAEGVTLDNVLRDIHHLLKGSAYNWYYPRRLVFLSWQAFEQAIVDEFIRPDHDDFLLEKIKNFRQNNESFSNFFSQIEMMFEDLEEHLSDSAKLKIIKRNLNNFYKDKIVLLNIASTNDLYQICKKIQNEWNNTSNFYQPDGRRRQDINEHNLNFTKETGTNTESSFRETNTNVQRFPRNYDSPRVQKCYNCGSTGHKFGTCKSPRNVFCYYCGTPNVKSFNCTNCRKNH
jgi:hypothetical protein